MLVGIGLLFEMQQANRQQATETQQQELAEQRARDEALQAYLNQMSGLLLERDLRKSDEDSEVRTLARARTLTVLGRLDPRGKIALMQFLVEADLVQRVDGRDPIISLRGAALRAADLRDADLSGANLSDANLYEAFLYHVDLSGANLSDAFLVNAFLRGANLSDANLKNANLSRAYLDCVTLKSRANLSYANLSHLSGCTKEQLRSAFTLKGATMPNGQKYEDWLKSKGSGENGENSSP